MNTKDLFLCPICSNIPLNERNSFIEKLNLRISTFKKGELAANQGDSVDGLYILLKGSVKTEMIPESGTVLSIETIAAPNPLAPAFIFAENNRFPVSVTALEDCDVAIIPKKTLMEQLANNETFLQGYLAFNSNRTTFLSERLKLLSVKTIKGKLAQYILGRTNNLSFTMDRNQTQLAEYFGVTRPSLARSLSEMIDGKIIRLEKKQGEIVDLNALKELIVQ